MIYSLIFLVTTAIADDRLDAIAERQAAIAAAPLTASDVGNDSAFEDVLQRDRKLKKIESEIGVAIKDSAGGERIGELLDTQSGLLFAHVKMLLERITALRELRKGVDPAQALNIEQRIGGHDKLISANLSAVLKNADRKTTNKQDASAEYARLDTLLNERAAQTAERLELVADTLRDERKRLRQLPKAKRESEQDRLLVLNERRERLKAALESSIALLRERGLDTTEYGQSLVASTGEISGNIFDSGVASGLLSEWGAIARDSLLEHGPAWAFNALIFGAILLGFWLLSRFTRRVVRRAIATSRVQFSTLLENFTVKLAGNLVLLIGILLALSQIGIELGPVLAGLGVAGFIIGFALQDTLSNFASGVMILIYRPFDVGDVVEAGGVSGKVNHMSLVSTTILTFDNQKLVVPNNKIWGDVIRNVNAEPTRRVDMTFGISYADDIERARDILENIVKQHELVLDEPVPNIQLHALADSSVNFIVRPWVKSEDYWTVFWDITKTVKNQFDANEISIPFPQRHIHVHQVSD